MITEEQVVTALGNMSVMGLIALTKELEQKWDVKAVPQVVQQAPVQTTETQASTQTEFSVILTAVAADKKISAIKAVREHLGLSLLDSKAALENLPKTIKEGVSKDEADELKRKLTEAGAQVEVK